MYHEYAVLFWRWPESSPTVQGIYICECEDCDDAPLDNCGRAHALTVMSKIHETVPVYKWAVYEQFFVCERGAK